MKACFSFVIFVWLVTNVTHDALATITSDQVAVIVNGADDDSLKVAEYYQKKRNIPEKNIIRINIPADKYSIDEHVFEKVYRKVLDETPSNVQYYALAWSKPYKVGCMSITSAFTFGFDRAYCAKGCRPTRTSSYFNSQTDAPYDLLSIRPSMMLAGSSLSEVYAMIDRGVAADHTAPDGTVYLMSTTDAKRNVRARLYPVVKGLLSNRVNIEVLRRDALKGKDDVLIYITGKAVISDIESNTFLPGAIADHLTSSGGRLFDSGQMSILRWLDAGATASYGTVVEPCAFPQKFPNPGILIDRYTSGESIIESYWKSVAWPGQGVFVGELMAAPYAREENINMIETEIK